MAINREDIILDKIKSKPWVRPSDSYDDVRDAWKIYKRDLFPTVYELAERKGFENLMKLIDWDARNPYLECLFYDTHHQPFYDGNHTNRKKEKLMKTKKDIDRIVIMKNDLNEVLLRAYSGDQIVEKAIAKCSPDDIFDFNIGAKLAMDRLYEGYDMTPKPKRKPYNGKIFVARYPGYGLRNNTLYSVTNGIIDDCLFGKVPFIYCDMSDEELSASIYHNVYGGYSTDEMAKCSAYFVGQ